MSSAVSAQPPGGLHRDPEPTSAKDQQKARALGLTSATGLVIGTIVGAGVFTMPTVLASAGTVSLVVLAVIAMGAMVLAVLFGQLTRRVPNTDGGLYAYARHEFGDFAGYLTGWCYWIQAWAGNAAIVSSWVFYVDALFGIRPSGLGNWGIALIGLWIPAAVNLAGLRQTAWLRNITVVLKYLPLLFVGVLGWFFVTKAKFGAFNASGGSLYSAIGIAAGVALFSFIGVETAAIIAKRVKDPRRNVGRASLLGTGASAIVYLAVSAAVMGLVSHRGLVGNEAPFVSAFETIFPHGAWAGKLVAALAATSGFGALIGWTLVTAEVSRAPANDGLFPRAFAWTDRNDTAWFGVVAAAALPSLLMLWRYTASSGLTVFTYLVSRRRPLQGWLLARDLSVAAAAALFSLWVTFAAGYSAVYQAMVVVLAGIIVYAFIRARREHLGQIPAPTDLTGGAGGRPPASQQSLAAAAASGETPEGQS